MDGKIELEEVALEGVDEASAGVMLCGRRQD
jgi:hypothetical protein